MPTAERLAQTLHHHKLRSTPIRRAVLEIMLDSPFALSGHEVEQLLPPGTDHITLYRTLRSLNDRGLIHQIIDGSDTTRYAACSIECSAEAHFDNHVHFKCTVCQHIFCLTQVAIPPVLLPNNFEAHARDYLLVGICGTCRPVNE